MGKKRRRSRTHPASNALQDLRAAYHYTWALRCAFQARLERSTTVGDDWAAMVTALEALEHDLKDVLDVLERVFQRHPGGPEPPRAAGNGLLRDV